MQILENDEKRYIFKIDTSGKINNIEIKGDSIADIVRADLGCSFEIVYPRGLGSGYSMLIDARGVLKDLAINLVGSHLYETHEHGIPIVGPIYISRIIDGNFVGLSEKKILDFQERFKNLNLI